MSNAMTPNHRSITHSAFLWTHLLNVPFWGMLTLLPFILYKDLHATPWQVTFIFAAKPLSACLSFYWSSAVKGRPELLRGNLIAANVLKYLPFLVAPWIDHVVWYIAASSIYMALSRGSVTAWVELLKLNIDGHGREKTFASGSVIDYLGGAFLPPLIGWLLDGFSDAWRWVFFATALIGITSTFLIWLLPRLPPLEREAPAPPLWAKGAIAPLWDSYHLVRSHRDFSRFLFGFMLGGSGLIIIQPALSHFFVDQLALSYTEMATVLTMCKGIGFALTTPLWVKAFHSLDLFFCCSSVFFLGSLFPLFLLAAPWHGALLYAAYLLYGFMQAGSELIWHMSAPLFAQNGDSTPFTNTTILTVGLRGLVIPTLGGLLLSYSTITATLLCAASCALLATYSMWHYRSIARSIPPKEAFIS